MEKYKSHKKIYIIVSALLSCIVLYIIEQGVGVNYVIKTLVKISLFTIIPVIYVKILNRESFKAALVIKKTEIARYKRGIILGILFFTIVIISYFAAEKYIDSNLISSELERKLKITPINFIFVGVYITLGNSFLEEFFFRGFLFLNLYKLGCKKFSYIFSAMLFGLYHIAIFKAWFTLPITLLALLGLVSVGVFFNWMDTSSENFINSWLSHIFADTAIIIIGLKIFYII